MRNASDFDVKCVVNGWYGDLSNVMFGVTHPWHGWLLAHIKQHVEINRKYMLAMETVDGCQIIAEYCWLQPVPKLDGTPAKPKKVHQRGTKPWLSKFEYADYDPKLIAPGIRVKCRDKKIRTVEDINYYSDGEHVIDFTDSSCAFLDTGLANGIGFPHGDDIMKILLEKKIDKPVHDRYNGYLPNVWHFWQGNTDVPPVDGDVKVQIFCRGNTAAQADLCTPLHANSWYWKWDNVLCDIIAFRIVGDK